MMKKLAEEEKQNSSNGNTTRIKVQEVVFCNEINKPTLPAVAFINLTYNEEPPLLKHTAPITSIFHPPSIA